MVLWPIKFLLLISLESALTLDPALDPVENQLYDFLEKHKDVLTESHGAPVYHVDATDALSDDHDIMTNTYLMDSLMHLARERIPPRIVHTDGAGAKGIFEVTNDVSKITNVKTFTKVGKKTPIFGRFATSVRDVGASETFQGNRGSAFKFYAEDGILDLTALVNPVFAVKNPADAAAFVHILKTNPKTNLFDPNMLWDFYLNHPEAITAQIGSLSPRGRPDGYRGLVGYCIHTFQVENDAGDRHFIRLNWIPVGGPKNLTIAKADKLSGTDPDYATRDLYDAIEKGNYPEWTLNMQVIPEKDVSKIKFDIFDLTLYWPVEDFPFVPIGKLVLNENVDNYHNYIEMSAFNPGHVTHGIRGVDRLYTMRSFLYREAAMHRMGPNFHKLKVNCPINTEVTNYNRNGLPPSEGSAIIDGPNYYPNSFNGPKPVNKTRSPLYKVHVKPGPTAYHYEQAAKYYKSLDKAGRQMIIDNAVTSLKATVEFIQKKVLKLFKLVDKDLSDKIGAALKKKAANKPNSEPTAKAKPKHKA